MASRSRPFHSRNTSSSSILSQKLPLRNGSSAKNAYDDVFEGLRKFEAPKLSSRVEDYDEIFGGSGGPRSSSIPFIDLSSLEETTVSTDVRSSIKDYSDIFGDSRDVGVSLYEDLLAGPARERKSSEETRPLPKAVSPPKGSKSMNDPKRHQDFPNEASPSFSGVKQFTMSYNRTDQRSNNGTNVTTHTAQLRAVPGFTCFIDTNTPLQKTDCSKSVPVVGVDDYIDMNFIDGTTGNKHNKASHLTKKQKDEGIIKPINGVSSLSNLPTQVINNKGASKRPKTSKLEVPESGTSGSGFGDCSPTFSDEELDVNSAAAASVAALRKAIDMAQESIRVAKESMERNKGFKGFTKPSSKGGLDVKERKENEVSGVAKRTKEKNSTRISERTDAVMQVFLGKERQNEMRSGKVAQESHDNVKIFIGREGVKEANNNLESDRECKAKRPASKQEISDQHGTASLPLKETVIFKSSSVETAKENPKDNVKLFIGREGVQETNNTMESDQECKAKRPASKREISDKHGTASLPFKEAGIYKSRSVETAKENPEGNLKSVTEQTCAGQDVEYKLKGSQKKATEQNCDWEHMEKKPEVCMTKGLEDHWNRQVTHEVQEQVKDENTAVAQDAERTEEKQKAFYEQERCEKKSEESKETTENEKRFGCQERQYDAQVIQQVAVEQDQNEKILNDDREKKEHTKTLENNLERNEIKKRREEACKTLNLRSELKQGFEVESNREKENDINNGEDNEKKYRIYELEGIINEKREGDASRHEKGCKMMGVGEGHSHEVNEQILEVGNCVYEEEQKELEAVEESYEPEMKETCEMDGLAQSGSEHVDIENKMDNATKSFLFYGNRANFGSPDIRFGQKQIVLKGKAFESTSNLKSDEFEHDSEGTQSEFRENGVATDQEENINLEKAHEGTQWGKMGLKIEASQPPDGGIGSDQYDNVDKTFAMEETKSYETVEKEIEEADIASDEVENETGLQMSHDGREWMKVGKNMGTSQPPSASKVEEKPMEVDEVIKTCLSSTVELVEGIKTSLHTEKNEETSNETFEMQEKKTKETVQREMKEKEHLRTIDEAKTREREREKEKERLAVERAIREVRERAYAEAREKAERAAAEARERAERAAVERATAEARQRVIADSREKYEKSLEGIKLAEKASTEAKRRAGRVAVERATAEARERALEKALSQKATSKPQTQGEEKVGVESSSGASRNNAARSTNDSQRVNTTNSESALRHKARIEREQRIAERADEALAEKNRRDLLAQKEQAERNRLAESLDAEVKRWSTGKEGNLRALLSTLQYILGPNSGWQPVSLTEIVISNAVKKAYRKATLSVHPDKLQQRGASIRQKYICEKVFDILQVAWNRFIAEER